MPRTKAKLTRFDAIRESEKDMRCMVRDMTLRRVVRDKLEVIQRQKRRGHEVSELEMATLASQNKKYSRDILERWDRLHRRMNREKTRQAEIANIFRYKGEDSGDSAHP